VQRGCDKFDAALGGSGRSCRCRIYPKFSFASQQVYSAYWRASNGNHQIASKYCSRRRLVSHVWWFRGGGQFFRAISAHQRNLQHHTNVSPFETNGRETGANLSILARSFRLIRLCSRMLHIACIPVQWCVRLPPGLRTKIARAGTRRFSSQGRSGLASRLAHHATRAAVVMSRGDW
jgi:hypothetical protein